VANRGFLMTWQTTWGTDVHVGFLHERIRLAPVVCDFADADGTWFLNLRLADLPGLIHWIMR
jgi:hypothetical protein